MRKEEQMGEETQEEPHWFEMPDDIKRDMRKVIRDWQKDHERQKLEVLMEKDRQLKKELELKGYKFIPIDNKVKVIYPDGRKLIDYNCIVLGKIRKEIGIKPIG